jgi:hypothetical protein
LHYFRPSLKSLDMKKITFVLLFSLISWTLFSQDDYPFPSLSPKGNISQVVGNTLVEVEYERPSARKRQVFGELVPWNKVWRTGAGYCTKVRFDKTVVVEGQTIPAGTYSLFTIPNPEEWVVIFNKDTTLYGSGFYDQKKDIARFVVLPEQTGRHYETLTIDIDLIPNNARMYISWVDTQISFDIITSTDEDMESFIKEVLSGKKKYSVDTYAGAADYYLFQGRELLKGLELADRALALDNSSWARSVKIGILEKLQLYQQAKEELLIEIERTKKETFDKEEYRINALRELEARLKRMEEKEK